MSDIYLKQKSDVINATQAKYDFLPAADGLLRTNINNYCLSQTLNLARARQAQKPDLKKLEKMLAQSRSIAITLHHKQTKNIDSLLRLAQSLAELFPAFD